MKVGKIVTIAGVTMCSSWVPISDTEETLETWIRVGNCWRKHEAKTPIVREREIKPYGGHSGSPFVEGSFGYV